MTVTLISIAKKCRRLLQLQGSMANLWLMLEWEASLMLMGDQSMLLVQPPPLCLSTSPPLGSQSRRSYYSLCNFSLRYLCKI